MEICKYKTRGLMLLNKKFLGFLYKSNDLTASKVLANGTDLQIKILIQERALNFAFFRKKILSTSLTLIQHCLSIVEFYSETNCTIQGF